MEPSPAAGEPFENRLSIPPADIAVPWNNIKTDTCASSTLPFLGRYDVVYDKAIHLIAAHAKTGKTTLLFHLIREWQVTSRNPTVLWISEESRETWGYRKNESGYDVMPINMIFGFEEAQDDVFVRIMTGEEEIVIIDTATALMGIDDENSNTLVTKVLSFWISHLRKNGKTAIIVHHLRKSEGDWGTGVAGATAWRRMVDQTIEVHGVEGHSERRTVKISGRYRAIKPMTYELVNGLLVRMEGLNEKVDNYERQTPWNRASGTV